MLFAPRQVPFAAAAAALALAACSACSSSAPTSQSSESRPAAPAKASPPKITQFYLGNQPSSPNHKALVCYGVEGAATVRVTPPVEELSPALARCFEVAVTKTMTLKLTAANRDGEEVSQELRLEVPKATAARLEGGMIDFFTSPTASAPRGTQVMLCYGVKGAARVTLTPSALTVEPKERACVMTRLEQTTVFKLTAYAASGSTDSRDFKIVAQ